MSGRAISKKKKSDKLSISILENAVDSFEVAIENYFDTEKPTAWKHAIQSAAQAIELFLKAMLKDRNPKLVFKNEISGFTVTYDMALERLAKIGIPISDEEKRDIKVIRELRNKLEHSDAVATREEVENALAHALRFIDAFLPGLDVEITDIIPDKERFLEFKQSIQPAAEWMRQAELIAARNVPWRDVSKGLRHEVVCCTACGGESVAVGDDIEIPKCIHCLEEFPSCEYCSACGTPVLDGIPEDDVDMCESCWDYRLGRD